MSEKSRLRIAICGGGIGGLALAVVLNKFSNSGIHIDLYESTAEFSQVGAGVTVWERTWYIFKLLGLDKDLEDAGMMLPPGSAAEQKPGFTFRKGDQEEDGFDFFQRPYGALTLHRADLLNILTRHLPTRSRSGFSVHFSKRLVSYACVDATSSVTLVFTDGTSATADVLVGADGIRSATRATMYTRLSERAENAVHANALNKFKEATWTGTYVYRALIRAEDLLKVAPCHRAAVNPMIHIVTYPVSQGRHVNIVAHITAEDEGAKVKGPDVVVVPKGEVLDHFGGWEPEVQTLLKCIENPSRWAISHIRCLPHYVDGNVALLGDAAHAMTTHLGAGAAQAIEDAFILGRLLSEDSVAVSNASEVLKVYDSVRRPFASKVVETSHRIGRLYEFRSASAGGEDICIGSAREGSNMELRKVGEEIQSIWESIWESLPDREWSQVLPMTN